MIFLGNANFKIVLNKVEIKVDEIVLPFQKVAHLNFYMISGFYKLYWENFSPCSDKYDCKSSIPLDQNSLNYDTLNFMKI